MKKIFLTLISLVLITTGTMHSGLNDVALFNAHQVKPTFVQAGFNNVHMGLSVYTGYLAADVVAKNTTDNGFMSKLPYQLTGAFLGGVASNFSFCKPWILTLGLGTLGYKFRAPLANVCAWMMTKPKQVQNQSSQDGQGSRGIYQKPSEVNPMELTVYHFAAAANHIPAVPSAPSVGVEDSAERPFDSNNTAGLNPEWVRMQLEENGFEPSSSVPSAPAENPMEQTVYNFKQNDELGAFNPDWVAAQEALLVNAQRTPVNPMEQTVFGYGFDPENLTSEQQLEALLRECNAGIISEEEFNQRSAGLIK